MCSRLGLASQHKVVSALRGTEVVSIRPTCWRSNARGDCAPTRPRGEARHLPACRAGAAGAEGVGICSALSHFCLASAGRERVDHGFSLDALIEHIRTHLAALDRLEQHGYRFPNRRIRLLATEARTPLADRIAAAMSGASVTREPLDARVLRRPALHDRGRDAAWRGSAAHRRRRVRLARSAHLEPTSSSSSPAAWARRSRHCCSGVHEHELMRM